MDFTTPEDRLETIDETEEPEEEKEAEEYKEFEIDYSNRIQPSQTYGVAVNPVAPLEHKEEKYEEKTPDRPSNTEHPSITIHSLFNHRQELSAEAEEKKYDYGYSGP